MKTKLMILAVAMTMVVSLTANAQDRTFYGEYEEYSPESSESVTLARCVEMTVTECGACAGDYDSGNCPKECYKAEALCIPAVQKQTAAPQKNKKAGEAWKKLKITISTLTENQEAFNASLIELKIALDALGNCHNGKGGADAEYACHPALDARVAELEACHNGKGGPDAELKCHPELVRISEAEAFIRAETDKDLLLQIEESRHLFKFDVGAMALGSTDFRFSGIGAGVLQLALNFGATDDFRVTINGGAGYGKGREWNGVWQLGLTGEFRLNDAANCWLGFTFIGAHEGPMDKNYNTFLGAGVTFRYLFPKNQHGFLQVSLLPIGANGFFAADPRPEVNDYDRETLQWKWGGMLTFTIGGSIFRD
jgi:hypothetical protein